MSFENSPIPDTQKDEKTKINQTYLKQNITSKITEEQNIQEEEYNSKANDEKADDLVESQQEEDSENLQLDQKSQKSSVESESEKIAKNVNAKMKLMKPIDGSLKPKVPAADALEQKEISAEECEANSPLEEEGSEIDSEEIEQMFDDDDDSKEEVQKTKKIKEKLLEGQEQEALEELIQKYGIDRVCFSCITGFSTINGYKQHMRVNLNKEAYLQGLGKFTCKYCNMLLTSKRGLIAHIRSQHQKNLKGKKSSSLTVRQQQFVNSYESQSETKKQVLKKMIEKKKKK